MSGERATPDGRRRNPGAEVCLAPCGQGNPAIVPIASREVPGNAAARAREGARGGVAAPRRGATGRDREALDEAADALRRAAVRLGGIWPREGLQGSTRAVLAYLDDVVLEASEVVEMAREGLI